MSGPRLAALAAPLLWQLTTAVIGAEEVLTLRVPLAFPEAMAKLQSVLKTQGHTLSRIQRVDLGLERHGYKSDKYRVVFFGRTKEIQRWSKQYPELIPFLPYKIVIFAEEEDTLLVAANPEHLLPAAEKKLQPMLRRWHGDLRRIFRDMGKE